MGLRTWLGLPVDTPSAQAALSGVTSVDENTWKGLLALAGYSTNQLPAIVTEADALKVPALANGIKLLTGIAQQLPLVCDPPNSESQSFLDELDPNVPRGWTVARLVNSLAFHGLAWLYVTRRTARGFPRNATFIDVGRVRLDPDGKVGIDGIEVDPRDMIRFDGVTPGLLTIGAEAIRTALANVRQTRRYAENPMPQVVMRDADGAEAMEPAEAKDYMQALKDAVTTRGYAYIAGLTLERIGWTASEIQLVEARQMDAVEMARLLAMPTRYLAAPEQGSSLTYSNLAEVRRDLLEVGGLALYMVPIEQRLSMPDVTPRGTTVKFDAESFFLRVTPDQPTPQAAQQIADQGMPA